MNSIPFDKRSGKIWFDGNLVEWKDAKLHVLTHGLHYASSVFEGLRVYDGLIFKLNEHTERLFYSASRLGFKIPYSVNEINEFCKEVQERGFELHRDERRKRLACEVETQFAAIQVHRPPFGA